MTDFRRKQEKQQDREDRLDHTNPDDWQPERPDSCSDSCVARVKRKVRKHISEKKPLNVPLTSR